MSSLMREVITELNLSSVSILPLHIWWFEIFYLFPSTPPTLQIIMISSWYYLPWGFLQYFFSLVSNIFCLLSVPYVNLVLWQLSFYLYESLQHISLFWWSHTHVKYLSIVNLVHHYSVLKYLHATVCYTVLLPL